MSSIPVRGGPVEFEFVTTDGNPVTAAQMRGRITLVVLIATYDVGSQAMVRFVSQLLHEHAPRINAIALVLEQARNAPLVNAYARTLDLGYPVALTDAAWIRGEGAFPGLNAVPSIVVLDRAGRERSRHVGFADKTTIEGLLREAEATD